MLRLYTEQEGQKRLSKKVNRYKKQTKAADIEMMYVAYIEAFKLLIHHYSDDDDVEATKAEIARDVSLIISRIGGVELSAKVKWVDLYSRILVKDDKKQYRVCPYGQRLLHK